MQNIKAAAQSFSGVLQVTTCKGLMGAQTETYKDAAKFEHFFNT